MIGSRFLWVLLFWGLGGYRAWSADGLAAVHLAPQPPYYTLSGVPAYDPHDKLIVVRATVGGACNDDSIQIWNVEKKLKVEEFYLARCGEFDGDNAGQEKTIQARAALLNEKLKTLTLRPMQILNLEITAEKRNGTSEVLGRQISYGFNGRTLEIHGELGGAREDLRFPVQKLKVDCGPDGQLNQIPSALEGWYADEGRVLALRTQAFGAQDWCDDPMRWYFFKLKS
jgi:hypothetical protein